MANFFDDTQQSSGNFFDDTQSPGYKPTPAEGVLQAAVRGGKEAFQQLPQLGYGLVAGAGAAAESAFGEGGIATGIKKAGAKGYEELGNKIAAGAQESDSFAASYDKAKEGDFGSMVNWLAHGIGYAGGQGIQMLATAGIGSIAGKAGLKLAAEKIAGGMVAKESARIAATEEGARLTAEQLAKVATANVAGHIGQTAAIGAQSFGMEGGEIFGDLTKKSVQENRSLTGGELAKAFGATLAAGGLEFVGDKLGLDLMLGKSRIFKPAEAMGGIGGRVARAGLGASAAAPIEGATEYGQTLLEEYGKGNDPFSEESLRQAKEAAALGVVGGVTMGGIGGAFKGPTQAAERAPTQTQPLQIGNAPDPLIAFPDGTVGRRSEVDAYINGLPEDQRIEARSRLIGMGQQAAERTAPTVEDISAATSVDDAIATAQDVVQSSPAALQLAAEAPTITQPAAEPTAIQLAMQQAVTQRESRQRESDDLAAIAQDIESNRVNKTSADRMAMLDTILANDEIVGIKGKLARFAGDLQRAGYTNAAISPEEWTHARRYSNAAIGLSEMDIAPPAPPIVQPKPNEMPAELVREKVAAAPQKIAAAVTLPAEYHDLARTSKNAEQFWKGLNKLGVPTNSATRAPLTAGYKALKKSQLEATNVAPEITPAVPVRNVIAAGAVQAAAEPGDIERPGAPTVRPVPERLPNTGAVQPATGIGVPGANEGVQQPAAINKRQESIAKLESLTGKELRNIAANDKRAYMRNAAADILQTRSQETRQKRSELAKKIYVKSKQIDPDRDTMAQAIAKLGSINSDSAAGRLRLAPEELNIRGHGVLRVFSKAGRSMDEIGAQLADLGYVQHDENGKYDQTDFEDKLAEVAGGYEVLTPNGMMQRAQENHDQAMQEVGATSAEEYRAIENYADNASDDVQNAIDHAFDHPISQTELSDDEIDRLFGIEAKGSAVPEVAAAEQARPSNQGNQAPAAGAENFLQSESETEANARLAAAKEKTRLADLELKRLDEVEKHAKIQKEIDQRQAASAENFQLGQTAEESLSGQEPLFSKAKKGGQIDENTGLPLNSDGTVTVYHHTSKTAAEKIIKTGILKAQAEPDVYVTTHKETDTGYGDTAVQIRVNPEKLQLDDEFPDGRKDFRLNVGKPGGSIKVKIDTGIVESRGQGASGITVDEVTKATARLRAKWIGFTNISTVQSVADLPTNILDRVNPDAQTEGFYDPQTHSVYLIADNIASPERAAWVAVHEVGHGGLRMLKDKTVDDAVKFAGTNRFVRELADAIAKDRGGLAQNIAVEESIAELAAATETNDFKALTDRYGVNVPAASQNGIKGVIARVVDAVKRFMSAVTGKPVADVSDADVRSLIAAQREAVETGISERSVVQGGAVLASTKADQTKTAAFRKWFGDSKVVDSNGNPLVVYHGTKADFDTFHTALGSHFGSIDQASDILSFIESDRGADGLNVMPAYLSIHNPKRIRDMGNSPISWAKQKSKWQDEGYDGLVYRNSKEGKGGDSWVAFERHQIKSATGNSGAFDVMNQDIRFSKASLGNLNAAQEAAAENVLGKPKTIGQRLEEFKQHWQKNLVQGVFDQFAPIKELSEKAYIQSRMSRGGDSTLEALMMYGKIKVDQDGFYTSDYQQANGKQGFAQAMAKLKGEHDRFFLWVAAHRADSLTAIGLENLFSQSDIAALKTLSQGQMKDGTPRQALYMQAMKDLNEFNDSVLKIAEDSGLIDAATRQMYKNTPYIPFYRLQEDGIAGFGMKAGLVNQSAWKKLKGGTEKLNEDLMANLLQNWSHLITASSKNRAAKASLDAAVNAGVATQVPSGAPGKGTVSYREAGKDKTFLVSDSHVMDAISALEYAGLGPWAKPLTTMKRMLTIGVTANPAFKIRNLIRDSVQAIGTADLSYNPLSNIRSGWMATADDSEIRAQMLASGGMIRFGSMLEGNSSQRAKDLIHHNVDPNMVLSDDNKVKAFWKGNIQPAIDAYQELGDRGEQVNRAALYQRLLDKGMSHGEASFWARDLMDFSSTGKWQAVRFLTQVVPFMNARLQGLYKLGRAGNQDIKRMGYVTGVVALASIALMAAYKDDDDWKKREDWDRQNYWWFKIGDTAFRIPKPFELGSIGTIAEMGVEYFSSDEMTGKRFVENIGAIVGSQLSMNPIPQLVKPMLDVYANKDSFTKRPIESQAMQKLQPKDRYNEQTSEVGRFLGSLGLPDPAMLMMGHYEELSPVKIDALTRGYFSWLGVMATTAIDYGIRPMMDRGERPAMKLKDAFLVGSFAESLPTNSSRYVSQMYDQANAIEQAYASYHQAIKQGDFEKAKNLLAENRKEILAYKNIEAIKRGESKINAQINRISTNKTMSADEKRRLIDLFSAQRDKLARKVMP